MKTSNFLISLLILTIYSCTSKIPYGSSYYFPQQKREVTQRPKILPNQTYVSIEKISSVSPSFEIQISSANFKIEGFAGTAGKMSPKGREKTQKLNSSERFSGSRISFDEKVRKKDLKVKLKDLKAELKVIKKQEKKQQQGMTKNIRNGIILGGVGLLMMIIFGAAGIGLLVGIGAILVVVGLVLILLDVIEV